MVKRCCLLLACLIAAAPASAQDLPSAERYNVRLEHLWWSPQPAGELQRGFSSSAGTVLDAQADLGLSNEGTNQLRGILRLGEAWKLRGSWTLDFGRLSSGLSLKGTVTSERVFTYGNISVQTGYEVRTSLTGNYGTVELEWDAVRRERGHLGLLVGAKVFDIDTLLLACARDAQGAVDPATCERVAETERLPVPSLGLTSRVYLHPRLSVEGEFSGLTIGDRGHVWEWLVAGRVHLSDRLAGTVGYHKLSLEGRDDRDSLRFDLGRWTFGAELSL